MRRHAQSSVFCLDPTALQVGACAARVRLITTAALAKSNLTVRVLTSLVAVPLLLALLFLGSPLAFACLLLAASAVASLELFAMTARGDRVVQSVGTLLCLGVSAVVYFAGRDWRIGFTVAIGLPIVGFLCSLFRAKNISAAGIQMMSLVAGPWYTGALLMTSALLRRDYGPSWVLLVLSIAWLADTGGYFVGRRFGKAKLYPSVSPNKTWAGLYGALIGSTLATVVIKFTLLQELPLLSAIALGVLGGLIGQAGDLAESLLKRSVGVKDSGTIIPGHGGILDRIDAVLFVSPAVYLYALWAVELK